MIGRTIVAVALALLLSVGTGPRAAVAGTASDTAEPRIELTPLPENPARPRMGDRLGFRSTIRNAGAAPLEGLVAWLSLVRVDPGQEQPVDLEDWSVQKAITLPRLEPGRAVTTEWPLRLIQAGQFRVVVSATASQAAALTASPVLPFTVLSKPVVESRRVLPVALGIPLLLAGGLLAARRRG